jgi:2-C-methyl-D-erythritol 4-phosphate cytidylyltransferase
MNVAMILAGGVGKRLGKNQPKQFVEVLGKPLIAYCLEIYEASPHIDAIEVVCKAEFIDEVKSYKEKYGFSKLSWVVPGGSSCQESTKNGIYALEGKLQPEDMLIIGMSTSVFVNDEIIKDSLDVAAKRGNAFCAMQCIYNMATTDDGISSTSINFKEKHKTLNMPWTAPFGTYLRLYKEGEAKGIEMGETSYAPTLFLALGETLYFSKDTSKNKLHVTTPEDLEIVTGCLLLERRVKLTEEDYE